MGLFKLQKFKDDQGRWRTSSLFWERSYDKTNAMFSMEQEDHIDGYASFHRLYLEIADPTEYRVATELLGGWEHWEKLCASKWFNDFIEPLRLELEIKLRSEALMRSYLIMHSDKPAALQASKMFAEGRHKEVKGRGRPSNAEVNAEAVKLAEIKNRVKEDAQRIGLVFNKDESNS